MKPNTTYRITVRGIWKSGQIGPTVTSDLKTASGESDCIKNNLNIVYKFAVKVLWLYPKVFFSLCKFIKINRLNKQLLSFRKV